MKKIVLILTLLIAFSGFSQKASDYAYIIIPSKFTVFNEPNKYNLNALTKSVFEKQGFQVFYENDVLPQQLAENRCKALYADLKENNSMFMTKIKIELKDCQNKLVYTSAEGTSREKEYAKSYIQAFREVGRSISLLKSNPTQPVVQNKVEPKTESPTAANNTVLFAQPVPNGFRLVDTTPKVVMKLLKSSVADCYIAQKDTLQGLVFHKNNQWFFEYYQGETLVSEKLDIKF